MIKALIGSILITVLVLAYTYLTIPAMPTIDARPTIIPFEYQPVPVYTARYTVKDEELDEPKTWNAPTVTPVVEAEARYSLTADERDLIERVVEAEAAGQPEIGLKAVAQCILIACEDDGIRPAEAIKKYKYAKPRPEAGQATKDAVSAVFDDGETVTDEPIKYFYNPNLVSSQWHESQIYTMTVGGHRFFCERKGDI